MSDSNQREPRSFEPPPWERDAFERLERERTAREPVVDEEVRDQAPIADEVTADAEPAEREPGALLRAPEPKSTPAPAVVPDAQIAAMLVELRIEEPEGRREYTGVVNAVAGTLVAGGLALVIWAAVLLAGAGVDAGWLAATTSALMMVWGLMMIGGAVVLWRKYNLRS